MHKKGYHLHEVELFKNPCQLCIQGDLKAYELAVSSESFPLGTFFHSGKSICYYISSPILDILLQARDAKMSSNTNYEKEMIKNIKQHTRSDGKFHASDSINLQISYSS